MQTEVPKGRRVFSYTILVKIIYRVILAAGNLGSPSLANGIARLEIAQNYIKREII